MPDLNKNRIFRWDLVRGVMPTEWDAAWERFKRDLERRFDDEVAARPTFGIIASGVVSTDGAGGISAILPNNLRFTIEGFNIRCEFVTARRGRDYVAHATGDNILARYATILTAVDTHFFLRVRDGAGLAVSASTNAVTFNVTVTGPLGDGK